MEIHHFQAVSFQDELWIVGALTGKYPHETPIPNILIFNPKTKSWRDGPALPKNRERGSAGIVVSQNKIYMVCGIQDGHFDGFVRWFDELDPKTGTWKSLPSAPRARDHVSAALVDGKLYLAGGRTSYAKIGKVLELVHFGNRATYAACWKLKFGHWPLFGGHEWRELRSSNFTCRCGSPRYTKQHLEQVAQSTKGSPRHGYSLLEWENMGSCRFRQPWGWPRTFYDGNARMEKISRPEGSIPFPVQFFFNFQA
jgi:hypothetical protein